MKYYRSYATISSANNTCRVRKIWSTRAHTNVFRASPHTHPFQCPFTGSEICGESIFRRSIFLRRKHERLIRKSFEIGNPNRRRHPSRVVAFYMLVRYTYETFRIARNFRLWSSYSTTYGDYRYDYPSLNPQPFLSGECRTYSHTRSRFESPLLFDDGQPHAFKNRWNFDKAERTKHNIGSSSGETAKN